MKGTIMFRKPQLNITLSNKPKTAKNDTNTDAANSAVDWDKIAKITQDTTKLVAKVLVAAYVVKTLIDTASDVTVIAAQNTFK